MSGFYRAFEERYYAPREAIKNLRRQYFPFVEPIKGIYETEQTFDLGCGRGEWLELMEEFGFKALGVDLDDEMLSDCYERNLSALKGDAVSFLQKLEAESQIVVSAFHVVEHISFSDLQIVVQEALRVLKPAGLLIMETPNPENLIVASKNFYLDPTHQRPIPSELLSFLAEHCGFARVKTIRLQERQGISANNKLALFDVLSGASPDYAVVAQKKGPVEVCAKFDSAFKRSYGIDLQSLANNYDQQAEEHTQWLKNEWSAAKQRVEELSKSTGHLEATLAVELQRVGSLTAELDNVNKHYTHLQAHSQQLQNELDAARAAHAHLQAHSQQLQNELDAARATNTHLQAHSQQLQNELDAARATNTHLQAHSQQLQNELDAARATNTHLQAHSQHLKHELDVTNTSIHKINSELQSVYNSKSWRITKPLRLLSLLVQKIIIGILLIPKLLWRIFKFPFKLILSGLIRFILKRPKLKAKATTKLKKYPRLQAHLRRFASIRGLVPEAPMFIFDASQDTNGTYAEIDVDLSRLNPRARRIYEDLKVAIEQQQKEDR